MKSHQRYGIGKRKQQSLEYADEHAVLIRQSVSRICVALVVAFLCGCTGSQPDIVEVMQTIVFRYDPVFDQSFESLHLYTVVSDPDGIGDLFELYVLNDDQAIFWKLSQDSWDVHENDDKIWIGSHTLRVPQSRSIPRGRYRVQVYDRAGEISVQVIEVLQSNSIGNTSLTFPSLSYREGVLDLVSSYEENIVRWYYHASGEIFEYRGVAGEIDLKELASDLGPLLESDPTAIALSSSFYIYSFPADDINDYYILVGPITIP